VRGPNSNRLLQELTEGHDAITRLMTTLDDRKHECLHRTFKDVAKAFFDVFKELVPAGEGNLVMERPVNAEYSGVKVLHLTPPLDHLCRPGVPVDCTIVSCMLSQMHPCWPALLIRHQW
jgi:hypothetical protein